MDSMLKDILITLRGALQHDMACFMKQTTTEIEAIGERVVHIENKLGDYAQAHNEVVDAHKELIEDICNIKMKMVDLEDCSRRKKVKFTGIPEMIPLADLRPFLQKMIAELLPSTKSHELVIDRAH